MAIGEIAGDRRQDRGHDRPGRDQETGLDRRGADHVVEVEGQGDKGDPLRDKAAHGGRDRQGKDRPGEQIDRQKRHRLAELAAHQEPADRDAAGEFGGDRGDCLVVADTVDAGNQQTEHRGAEERAPQIKAMLARRCVGQIPERQQKGDDADRHVDREEPRPRRYRQDRRRDARAGRRRHRHDERHQGDAAAQLAARIGKAHERRVDAHHPGGAEPLQGTAQGQHVERGRERADQRRRGVEHEAETVDPAVAKDVAERGEG